MHIVIGAVAVAVTAFFEDIDVSTLVAIAVAVVIAWCHCSCHCSGLCSYICSACGCPERGRARQAKKQTKKKKRKKAYFFTGPVFTRSVMGCMCGWK